MKDDRPKKNGAFDGIEIPKILWSEQLKAITVPYAVQSGMTRALSTLRESVSPLSQIASPFTVSPAALDAMASLRSIYSEMLSSTLDDFAASIRTAIDTESIIRSISDSLRPLYDQLSSLDFNLDWQGLRRGYVGWGDFGWVIPHEMGFSDIRAVPQSLGEADRACMRYFNRSGLDLLFERLYDNSHKKKDLREAIELFNDRRYKPCAMMLCALIEGELIKLGGSPSGKSRRSGKTTLDVVSRQISERDTCLAFAFENYSRVWAFFFKSGKDFSREQEGELNRNFLMHGMMYKPVRKKTCVKLFSMLDATTDVLPMIARA